MPQTKRYAVLRIIHQLLLSYLALPGKRLAIVALQSLLFFGIGKSLNIVQEERILRDTNAWQELGLVNRTARIVLWLVGPEISDEPIDGLRFPPTMKVL